MFLCDRGILSDSPPAPPFGDLARTHASILRCRPLASRASTSLARLHVCTSARLHDCTSARLHAAAAAQDLDGLLSETYVVLPWGGERMSVHAAARVWWLRAAGLYCAVLLLHLLLTSRFG